MAHAAGCGSAEKPRHGQRRTGTTAVLSHILLTLYVLKKPTPPEKMFNITRIRKTQTETAVSATSQHAGWLSEKSQTIPSAGEDIEPLGRSNLAVWEWKVVHSPSNSLAVPHLIKQSTDPEIPLLDRYIGKMKIQAHTEICRLPSMVAQA